MYRSNTENVKSIVFLFGAGASYGAGDIVPESPPLGSQLYKALAAIYPNSWGIFPGEIKQKFEENFELGMAVIYEQYSMSIAELMQELAVYLIQFRPYSGASLYCRLVRTLQTNNLIEHVLFSTLNYDCILEFSLLNQGIPISYFPGGQNDKGVPVWKLHGSCNMFSSDIQAAPGILYARGVIFEGRLQAYIDRGTVIENCLNTALAPAMCLYMKGKPLQISPSVIKYLQEAWRDAVAKSDVVCCIGVNPLPEDDHIWNPLAETTANLYCIGNERAFTNWIKNNRKGASEFIASRFNTGFHELERRLVKYATHRS